MAKAESKSILGIAIRDVTRLQKVASVVARHGFGEVLLRMPFASQVLGASFRAREEEKGTPAERFAKLLGALGPTYIKLGQVLSMRADLLPPDYVRALSTLQDRAPPIPLDQVRKVIEQGLGRPVEELYDELSEEPLATASIGQAHVAKTKDGRAVVVKVQRPGIGDVMRSDLDLLYVAARGLEASIEELKLMGPSAIVAEFEKSLLRELNFTAELANLVRIRQLLDPKRPVVVPEPIPELSCRTVLTMIYFEGKPIRDLAPRSKEARHAVEEVLHMMTKGVVIDGFFHGDPHSGNILVDEKGTLCFLDWGLSGSLSTEQRDDLVTLVLGTILDDAATCARVLLKMGTPTQRVDVADLQREIVRVRKQYVMVKSVGELDTQGFIEEFANAVGKYKVKLATEYSVLVKSAGTIEGLVRQLYPDIDALPIVKPYVEQVFKERWNPQQMLQSALGGGVGMASLLRTVPTHLDQILHDFETGNVQIKPITPALDKLPDTLYQSATRISVALFAAAMSVCSAMVVPSELSSWVGWSRLMLSLLLGGSAVAGWTVTFWWHWLGRGVNLRLTPLFKLFRRIRS